jgi:hypothetical protein
MVLVSPLLWTLASFRTPISVRAMSSWLKPDVLFSSRYSGMLAGWCGSTRFVSIALRGLWSLPTVVCGAAVAHPPGDILLFLTGQEEIETACQILYERMKSLVSDDLWLIPSSVTLFCAHLKTRQRWQDSSCMCLTTFPALNHSNAPISTLHQLSECGQSCSHEHAPPPVL